MPDETIQWESWGALLKDGRLILEKSEATARWFVEHAGGQLVRVKAELTPVKTDV